MSAPFVNTRVKVEGTSQAELNGQQGLATAYNSESMRYTVILDNGRSIALKVSNLIPIGEAGEGGSGRFAGMPAGMGMPDLSQVANLLPTWLRDKLMRGEAPTMEDLKRMLPAGVTVMHVGYAAVLFFMMLFKFGVVKTVLLFSVLGFVAYTGLAPFSHAGGGLNGLKAAGRAVGEEVSAQIRSRTGQSLSPSMSLGAIAAVLLAVMYYIFLTGGAAVIPSSSARTSSYNRLTEMDAYTRGFDDATAGRAHDWSVHEAEFRSAAFSAMPDSGTYSAPYSQPSSGGVFGGLGFGKIISIGILGKQVYSLGAVSGAGWQLSVAMANVANMGTAQKLMMAFMALRIVGMSPI